MSLNIADKLEEVRALPPEKRVLKPEQQEQLRRLPTRLERIAYSRSIRDKYAHLPVSSDAFAARKVEEIALEDRRR